MLSEGCSRSSRRLPSKTVSFELLLDEGSKTRARIPLRILVNPHDDAQSIITTVKNFYGIYDGHGVSFEDTHGHTLIARYENLVDHSMVYVRTVMPLVAAHQSMTAAPLSGPLDADRKHSLGEPFQMGPPSHLIDHTQSPSRPSSRLARKRSSSPINGRGRRSISQQKGGLVSVSRGSSANGSFHDDQAHDHSDSDNGHSSVTGSRKARSEQFASADISLDNVVQEGRRVRSLFDSSVRLHWSLVRNCANAVKELPLFVPPQVPITASISSASPQRRPLPQEGPIPYSGAPEAPKYILPPLPSPRSQNFSTAGIFAIPQEQNQIHNGVIHGHRLRDRPSVPSSTYNRAVRPIYSSTGILPTPDPTVASCISDEDVARQLIALGDMSNYSHGRTSNSTQDETFSGVADAASLTGATSESDDTGSEEPHNEQRRLNDIADDEYIKSEMEEHEGAPRIKKIKTKLHDGPSYRLSKSTQPHKTTKSTKIRSNSLPKAPKLAGLAVVTKVATAPNLTSQDRKTSSSSFSPLNFQQLPIDEDDLSSKPRCQRCRKSKKGCDRERPCGRCKDAGIGIEGCVSEDEGNGRKGRYGRHMGVAVKKNSDTIKIEEESQLFEPFSPDVDLEIDGADRGKKRKR